jgi:rod shape-determining protein MreC
MRDTRRTRIVLTGLLLGGFVLITLDPRGAHPGSAGALGKARDVAQGVIGPVESAAGSGVHDVGTLFTGWGRSGADQKRIVQLNTEVAALKEQDETVAEAETRATQLDQLLHLTSVGGLKTVPARLVALTPGQDGSWAATIDAGSRDGIAPDQTVLDGDGLVGRTVSVGSYTATVLFAVDPSSTVGVRLVGSGEIGTAQGQDSDTLRVAFLDPQLKVEPGTVVVTFGSAGGTPFVPGIPVGTVRKVLSTPGALTRTVLVTPYADPTTLDTVAVVVQPPRTDPRDAMVPGAAQ